MRSREFLVEVRKSMLDYFKQQYPNVPEYVVQDFMYKNYKDEPGSFDIEFGLYLNDLKWSLQTHTVTLSFFDKDTQQMLMSRMKGERLNFVKNDDERHNTQLELLKKRGPSNEPIIVTKHNEGYELQEGWHRTIQSLLLWPDGYKQKMWVGEE